MLAYRGGRVSERLSTRGCGRGIRVAARPHDSPLSGLREPADIDLRSELEPGRDLSAVRDQPRPDRPALGVRISLPRARLADVRPDRRLGATGPGSAVALDPAQVQPWRS